MNKQLLEYLIHLFAIIANIFPFIFLNNVKDFLKSFVLKEFGTEVVNENLALFNTLYQKYSEIMTVSGKDAILEILHKKINSISRDTAKKYKIQVLIRLLLFEKFLLSHSTQINLSNNNFSSILDLVISNMEINNTEYLNCKGFISESLYQIPEKNKILIISKKKFFELDINFLQNEKLQGQLVFLHIESVNIILFYYKGSDSLQLNNRFIFSNHIYVFKKGFSIRNDTIEPIYFNQVLHRFLSVNNTRLYIDVNNIEFRYKNSNNGIHPLNIHLESGQLVGIIGRSGVGKSLLMNILNGRTNPQKGSITINNIDLRDNSNQLNGLIGYIPQDDFLLEDLSVFTNLYINAKLCFSTLSHEQIKEKVNNLLDELELYSIRDLKVGSILNKLISGGQRKKLNIALELNREPWILYADEPTSGLSSSDSEEIMQLLAEQTIKGRIVILTIHQPSSDIFKLFDKILILEKEGYPVYFGNPLNAISYFNAFTNRIITSADNCNICENINPESVFKIIEEKKVDEMGDYLNEQKISPIEWNQHFIKQNKEEVKESSNAVPLPVNHFSKQGSLKQFLIFSQRNLLTKVANTQYVLISLLITPILAVLLSVLCKYRSGYGDDVSRYVFANNDNIPSFIFMSVLVSLFVGLIISAEEIIRDRKILMRESFLKLSKLSYLNSKVLFLFLLSALQNLFYVLIANSILEIRGMTFEFWLTLFSVSCFANILGLMVSSIFRSVVVVYIMVPLLIVPQILLSGVVIDFDKINNNVASHAYVPIAGEIMASRWAYEALVVTQYKNNDYEQHFFNVEQQLSNIKYNLYFLIPEIKKSLYIINNKDKGNKRSTDQMEIILNTEKKLNIPVLSDYINGIAVWNDESVNLIRRYVDNISVSYHIDLERMNKSKDSITSSLVSQYGSIEHFLEYKNQNYNTSVADLVLKRKNLEPFHKINNNIFRKTETIYQLTESRIGRAQFFASSKIVAYWEFDTLVFNIFIIWLMSLFIYFLLGQVFKRDM